jgi:hypothetical protein
MTRRSMLVALSVIAAIAVAVPAIAQVDDQGENFKRISQELRKLAHKALKKSNKALKKAKQAGQQGPAGQSGAPGQPGAPGTAGAAPAFAEAPGLESTADDTQFVQLPGGPSVTVNVPQATNGPPGTGFVEVVASAVISDEAGAVALYEDGVNLSQNDQCALAIGFSEPPLFASLDGLGGPWGTPGVLQPIETYCATSGEPGPVTFITTPGTHTYELWYGYCGCSGTDADFSDRRLWVTPLG